jgi:hypothetical protein
MAAVRKEKEMEPTIQVSGERQDRTVQPENKREAMPGSVLCTWGA